MAKKSTLFECEACGNQQSKWLGKCPQCGTWESFVELTQSQIESLKIMAKGGGAGFGAGFGSGGGVNSNLRSGGVGFGAGGSFGASESGANTAHASIFRQSQRGAAMPITQVAIEQISRRTSGDSELDIVLGGGVVEGSLVLIGGSPGIGKSTLLLKIAANLARGGERVLYVSGEESKSQIKMRADRLGANEDGLFLLTEINLEAILGEVERAAVAAANWTAEAGNGANSNLDENGVEFGAENVANSNLDEDLNNGLSRGLTDTCLDAKSSAAARNDGAGANAEIFAQTTTQTAAQPAAQPAAQNHPPRPPQPYKTIIIDSIQTLFSDKITSAPGSVSQVREVTFELMRLAKSRNITIFIIGHITKDGAIAGPRILEHMVDVVLYFEGDAGRELRILRGFKNRFGSTSEVGIFEMNERGLMSAKDASSKFFTRGAAVAGSALAVTMEGSRALVVEVQALVCESGYPKRSATGFDKNRLDMLLALLERKLELPLGHYDVFVNVTGGVKITETACDLAVVAAIVSSFRNRPVSKESVFVGEISLNGEIRDVFNLDARLREAALQRFKKAITPSKPAQDVGLQIYATKDIARVLEWM